MSEDTLEAMKNGNPPSNELPLIVIGPNKRGCKSHEVVMTRQKMHP